MKAGERLILRCWLECMNVPVWSTLILCVALSWGQAPSEGLLPIRSIQIGLEQGASPVEQRVAELLKNRIRGVTPIEIGIGTARKPGADLSIYLGKTRDSGALNELCTRESIRPPGKEKPNPEGFALKTIRDEKERVLIALGADERGVLYAVGEILRRLHYEEEHVELPALDVSTSAPKAIN